MPLQNHRQILRKDTARHHHVAAALLRFQLQFGLHVRDEADRAHSQVIELKSSHAIPVTFPEVVVDVIKQAASATIK